MKTILKNPNEFLETQLDKGTLLLLENYLDGLPHDYVEAISFVHGIGLDKEVQSLVVHLDEEQLLAIHETLSKDRVEVLVINPMESRIWNVMFVKNDTTNPATLLVVGGDSFRNFCDERNLYYQTLKDDDGNLLSCSDLRWQKHPGEDCRQVRSIN